MTVGSELFLSMTNTAPTGSSRNGASIKGNEPQDAHQNSVQTSGSSQFKGYLAQATNKATGKSETQPSDQRIKQNLAQPEAQKPTLLADGKTTVPLNTDLQNNGKTGLLNNGSEQAAPRQTPMPTDIAGNNIFEGASDGKTNSDVRSTDFEYAGSQTSSAGESREQSRPATDQIPQNVSNTEPLINELVNRNSASTRQVATEQQRTDKVQFAAEEPVATGEQATAKEQISTDEQVTGEAPIVAKKQVVAENYTTSEEPVVTEGQIVPEGQVTAEEQVVTRAQAALPAQTPSAGHASPPEGTASQQTSQDIYPQSNGPADQKASPVTEASTEALDLPPEQANTNSGYTEAAGRRQPPLSDGPTPSNNGAISGAAETTAKTDNTAPAATIATSLNPTGEDKAASQAGATNGKAQFVPTNSAASGMSEAPVNAAPANAPGVMADAGPLTATNAQQPVGAPITLNQQPVTSQQPLAAMAQPAPVERAESVKDSKGIKKASTKEMSNIAGEADNALAAGSAKKSARPSAEGQQSARNEQTGATQSQADATQNKAGAAQGKAASVQDFATSRVPFLTELSQAMTGAGAKPMQVGTPQLQTGLLSLQEVGQFGNQLTSTGQVRPPMSPAPAQIVNPQMVTNQITMAISKQAGENQQTFRISLNPAELGQVDIKMDFNADGRMTATVTVENEKTLALLQRDQGSLEKALESAGFDAGGNNLNFSLKKQHQDQKQALFANNNNGNDAEAGESDEMPYHPNSIMAQQQMKMTYSDNALDINI